MDDELRRRLSESAAVRSLRSEQITAKAFVDLEWAVKHGSYFDDPASGKPREIDIVASRTWEFDTAIRQTVTVRVVVEMKTMRDYHVVFAPLEKSPGLNTPSAAARDKLDREWIGGHKQRLAATLREAGASAAIINESIRRFAASCFGGTPRPLVYDLFIAPPPAIYRASAFRETNVGHQRDSDQSVVWNAMQAVEAAIAATKTAFLDRAFRAISDAVKYGNIIDEPIPDAVENNLSHVAGEVLLFHPVVVLESRLWWSDATSINEIPWCRVYRLGHEWMPPWCDVVTLSAAPDYLQKITQHYISNFDGAVSDTA